MALTQKKICKTNVCCRTPWARGHSLKGARIMFFECSQTPTSHSFGDIGVKIGRHITLGGGTQSLSKNFGGQTPWGGIFSQIFLQDFELKI